MNARQQRIGRRLVSALLVVLGLALCPAGYLVANDGCEIACGTAAEQRVIDGLGYGGLALGVLAVALALSSRRAFATAAIAIGVLMCLLAAGLGLSHLR